MWTGRGCCDLTCGPGSPGLRPSAVGTASRWPISLRLCALWEPSPGPSSARRSSDPPGGCQSAAVALDTGWPRRAKAAGCWLALGLFGSGARGKPRKAGGQEPAWAGQVEATWLGGAVTRMGQAALRPLGVAQRRTSQSWYCWAGGEMVWGLVPGLGWGQRLPSALPLLRLSARGGEATRGWGVTPRGRPMENAGEGAVCSRRLWLPCQEGHPLFIPEHCGALQRGPEPAGPLAQPRCSPESHLLLGLKAQLAKPPLPAGKPPAGRSGF